MVTPGPFDWDPRRPFDALTSLWSNAAAAAMPAAGALMSGPGVMLRGLFDAVRRNLVGRRFTLRAGGAEIRLRLTDLEAGLDPATLALGQLDDVRLRAEDVETGDDPPLRLARVHVVARNVHVRPTSGLTLVAAPVELEIGVRTAQLTGLLQDRVPWLRCDVGSDAVPRLAWRRYPEAGQVEVQVEPDGSRLWWRPRAVVLGRRRIVLPVRTPGVPTRRPALPAGVQLLSIAPGPEEVALRFRLASWQQSFGPRELDGLLRQLRSATNLLDLSGG